ncbi:cell division control protein 45 homolog [Aethina tumida]|uniref:cell division control protein 45 homolog n=1 Tax=Aethina tumida TaxID=116153 RepID=UPI00096AF0C8|nr:cell division control protein 45 homolog [Aethina tumida]
MYVEDLKNEFYEFLAGKRIFLMIHYDIDSICTCKILQSLLKYKHVRYTLAVIRGIEDLKTAYRENCNDVKYFVLVNCGGTIDIVETLEAEEDVTFFIIDSHRPTDLCNIYSNGQVKLLSSPEDDGVVPDFHDIFREESDEEDDEENDEGVAEDNEDVVDSDDERETPAAKRRRLNEEAIMKRRERRLWEDNRNKLMFDYSQFTYHAKASAIYMFSLAWKLNKDDKDLVWLAIVALTEQFLLGKIHNTEYTLEMQNLRAHVTRLQNKTSDTDVLTSLKIGCESDLRLTLYRHWSVEESLKYSMFSAVKMKLWSLKGDKKLQELLADMGFPLVQSKQLFKSMDLQLRKEFHTSLEKLADKYNLRDIVYTSFTIQFGYRNKYCASDIVYALLAILEASARDKSPEECFNLALDCLSRTKKEVTENAIEKAKIITKTVFKTVQSALDMKQIITAGPFVYYIIQEGCLEWYMFSHLHVLSLLAQFILRAYVSMSRNRKAPTLPLIVSAPKNPENGTCIILGIPPLCEDSPKSFFGKAFEQAAERIRCDAASDYFDTSYFEIHIKDRTRFFDALTALLT